MPSKGGIQPGGIPPIEPLPREGYPGNTLVFRLRFVIIILFKVAYFHFHIRISFGSSHAKNFGDPGLSETESNLASRIGHKHLQASQINLNILTSSFKKTKNIYF